MEHRYGIEGYRAKRAAGRGALLLFVGAVIGYGVAGALHLWKC